jgi:hypothetical protein
MAIQLSTAVRNAMLDVIETTVGTSAKIRISDGYSACHMRDGRKWHVACAVCACLRLGCGCGFWLEGL